jgi:hypothetical protein
MMLKIAASQSGSRNKNTPHVTASPAATQTELCMHQKQQTASAAVNHTNHTNQPQPQQPSSQTTHPAKNCQQHSLISGCLM